MAATFVTPATLRAALGIGSLYDNSLLETVCQAAEDLINKQLWYNEFPVIGASLYQQKCFLVLSGVPTFAAGQTVTINGVGAHYNGNHTITGTYPWTTGSATFPFWALAPYTRTTFPYGISMIQFEGTGHPDDPYHQILPYGKAAISAGSPDYAAEPLIQEAALMIAIDIFQARQQSNAGGVSPDFSPSPYRMGRSLLSRVQGLISPFLSPRGMIG